MTVPGRKLDDRDGISIRRVTPDYHQRDADSAARRPALRADGSRRRAERRHHQRVRGEEVLPRRETRSGRSVKSTTRTRRSSASSATSTRPASRPRRVTEVYVPMAQAARPVWRTRHPHTGDPYHVLPASGRRCSQVLPDVPLRNVRTMEEMFAADGAAAAQHAAARPVRPARPRDLRGRHLRRDGLRRRRSARARSACAWRSAPPRSRVVGMVMRHACAAGRIGLVIGGAAPGISAGSEDVPVPAGRHRPARVRGGDRVAGRWRR